MTSRTVLLVAVGLLVSSSACQREKSAGVGGSPSASVSGTPSAPAAKPWVDPSDDPTPASASVLPSGKPVSAKTLAFFDLPQSKRVPTAIWSAVDAEKDGHRHTYLADVKGSGGWVGVTFVDCRRDKVREYAGKPLKDLSSFSWCYVTLPEKFKGYPSYSHDGGMVGGFRVVRAGNVVLEAGVFERPKAPKEKWNLAQLDEIMSEVDWATIASW